MTLLVFGQNGQVAQALAARVADAVFAGSDTCDLSLPGAAARLIRSVSPSAVVNAAAYTHVDGAEDDIDAAMRLNRDAPAEMAGACAAGNIPLLHLSTDYVFDGAGGAPYPPNAKTNPLGAYGASKLAGEDAILATKAQAVILRTSAVFSQTGQNFVKTMLALSQSRDELRVVSDQVTGPTSAASIAAACLHVVKQMKTDPAVSGLYHFCGAPAVSWADFARAIFDIAGADTKVVDIPTSGFPTRAKRPPDARLDCASAQSALGLAQPDWRDDLKICIERMSS